MSSEIPPQKQSVAKHFQHVPLFTEQKATLESRNRNKTLDKQKQNCKYSRNMVSLLDSILLQTHCWMVIQSLYNAIPTAEKKHGPTCVGQNLKGLAMVYNVLRRGYGDAYFVGSLRKS
jgi:hypothetical protein